MSVWLAIFLHIAIPLMHEVPAVSYIGANASASQTSKSVKEAKDGHGYSQNVMSLKRAAFGPKLIALMVVV